METIDGKYSTGEPKDNTLRRLIIGYVVVVLLFVICFSLAGYGGALLALILMFIRLLFVLLIPGGLVLMVIGLIKRNWRLMRWGLGMFVVGLIGTLILVLFALIF